MGMGSIILMVTAVYAALVLALVILQRKIMYRPDAGEAVPAFHGLARFSDIAIESEDGTPLQLWYHEANEGMPTVVYFHGNAGHLGDRAGLFDALANKGLGVAAVSYRGYGKSKGIPNERGIFSDARAAVKWVKSRGIGMSNMGFYGESLGTGVAVRMASEFTPKALFLQAPYTSVANRAAEIYWYVPVRFLLRDHFDSISHIHKVKVPLMIFQGRKDLVIPPHHAEAMFERANEPKKIHFFDEVGHTEFDNHLIAQHVLETLTAKA